MHKVLWAALFIIFAALAGVVLTPGNAFAEMTGRIGDDLTYTIEGGKMTISGNGAMWDYEYSFDRPYDGQAGDITEVVIGEDVTSIGKSVFANCASLTSVTIPEGVTSIGDSAFYGCIGLESVTMPEGVTSIGKSAFLGCKSLISIKIPDTVTSIGDSAFDSCIGLQSVVIPEGVTSIGDQTFLNCESLASVTIPDGVTSIGFLAFGMCVRLTSIEIPEGVESIGQEAFHTCLRLTSITIPSTVTSIGNYTFSACEGLETAIFPEDLDMSDTDLEGLTKATKITYTVSDGKVTITEVTLGEGRDKVEIGDTVNGMEVAGVAEDFRALVSGEEGHKHKGGTADCTHKAKCVICGEEYGDFKHEEKSIPAVPATCADTGLTAGVKCSVCGQVLVAPETVPATGRHSFANGKCMVCGADDPDYKPEEKPEEKPGDKPGEEPGNKPDEKPGGTTHTHSAQGGWQYDSGSHWRACECGEVLERENHDLEWVIDRKPTEEEEGLRHRECSVCGYAGAEVSIPALGTEKEAQPDGEEDDALPEEPAEAEEPGSDAGEYTDNPGTGGASPVHALLLAAGALGALLWLRKRRG